MRRWSEMLSFYAGVKCCLFTIKRQHFTPASLFIFGRQTDVTVLLRRETQAKISQQKDVIHKNILLAPATVIITEGRTNDEPIAEKVTQQKDTPASKTGKTQLRY